MKLPNLFTSVFSLCQLGGWLIDYLGYFTLCLLVGSVYLYNNYSTILFELSITSKWFSKIIIYNIIWYLYINNTNIFCIIFFKFYMFTFIHISIISVSFYYRSIVQLIVQMFDWIYYNTFIIKYLIDILRSINFLL